MDGIKEKINTVLIKYPAVDKVFTNLSEKIKVEKGNEWCYIFFMFVSINVWIIYLDYIKILFDHQ